MAYVDLLQAIDGIEGVTVLTSRMRELGWLERTRLFGASFEARVIVAIRSRVDLASSPADPYRDVAYVVLEDLSPGLAAALERMEVRHEVVRQATASFVTRAYEEPVCRRLAAELETLATKHEILLTPELRPTGDSLGPFRLHARLTGTPPGVTAAAQWVRRCGLVDEGDLQLRYA